MISPWTVADRHRDLDHLRERGVEVLVIGGGITGAGIVRDAALRGFSAALIEREDFASGTSSYTSKMVHGGLRYIAEGQLGVTRQSCVERDLLASLHPNLVAPLPFLFCAFKHGVPRWKMTVGLSLYSALSGFKHGFRTLDVDEVRTLSRDLDLDGLRGAGLYYDQQVDDARLVLETVKDARRAGASIVHHAELAGFIHERGRIVAARVKDRLRDRELLISAAHVVNASGPNVDRVRALDDARSHSDVRPAKGVHLVIERSRVHADAAVAFQAEDGRHMFLCPWGDVHLIGTTDTFTDEFDEPRVSREDVAYCLRAVNRAFSKAKLEQADLVSVYAGVRPLIAPSDAEKPPSSVSREHHISDDASGLLSVAGGKLTTYRAMAEQIVDRLVMRVSPERRSALKPCSTRTRALREDRFDRKAVAAELCRRFALDQALSERLCVTWGRDAEALLETTPQALRRPIAGSRYLLCEVSWAFRHECAATLNDVLERRVRVAMRATGQGLSDLPALVQLSTQELGLDEATVHAQAAHYRDTVQRRYTVCP